jgi:hypothetical protein
MMRVAITLFVTALVCADGFAQDRRGQGQARRAKQEKPVDWNARYEKLLEDNADIRAKVESGGATKEQVIAWMKGQKKEAGWGGKKNAKKKGDSKPVDWNANYEQFLRDNAGVKAKVDSGAITKEQVIAGMQARQKESRKDNDLEAAYRMWLQRDAKLRKAIEDGNISKEDLMAKLEHMVRAGKLPWDDKKGVDKKRIRRDRNARRAALRKKLVEFVKAGKLSKKDLAMLLETAFPNDREEKNRARRDEPQRRDVDRDRRRR